MKYDAMIKSIQGVTFPLFADKKATEELSGNDVLELEIHRHKLNNRFINDLTEYWRITYESVDYRIIKLKEITEGDGFFWSVSAIPLFHDDMTKLRMYKTLNGSYTATEFFTLLQNEFLQAYPNDSEMHYNFIVVDAAASSSWQGLGKGDDLMTIFQKGLDRYDFEFEIIGRNIYLKKKVGRDVQFQYRHKLNADDIVKEIDAVNFYTYARGFGNLPDDYKDFEAEAKLKTEYVSPLENILGMKRHHAPPIVDGRVTNVETMQQNLKKLVDESLKISITASIYDLRRQGYEYAQAKKGDSINLIDERIGLNTMIRAVKITTEKDGFGRVKDIQVTLGSPSIRERHQSKLNGGIAMLTALLDGKIKLPRTILDDAVNLATNLLLAAETQLEFTDSGLIARNPSDPNLLVLFNSAGIGISKDGGNTFGNAITGAGIVADYITSGAIDTYNVRIEGTEGYFFITGDKFKAISLTNPNQYTEITPAGAYFKGGAIEIETRSGRKVIIDGYINRAMTGTPRLPSFKSFDVLIDEDWYKTDATGFRTAYTEYYVHEARYLVANVALNEWGFNIPVEAIAETSDGTAKSNVFSTAGLGVGSHYDFLKIDLGEPLDHATTKQVYYRMRVLDSASTGRMHLANRYLTDFI